MNFKISKYLKLVFIFALLSLPLLASLRNSNLNKTTSSALINESNVISKTDVPSHSLVFYEEDLYFQGIDWVENFGQPFDQYLYGGIIPHDLLPSYMIADFMNKLVPQNPQTIILLGPNHHEKGIFPVLTSKLGWSTPTGIIQANVDVINKLEKANYTAIEDEVLANEHSVAGIMPYIKYYLPDTQVVPLIISSRLDLGKTELLAKELATLLSSKQVVIISAVDFSHYLNSHAAEENDKLTIELIKKFNYQALSKLNNEYLDSAPSIITLLMAMEQNNTTKNTIFHNTNSGEMVKNDTVSTTSYFTIAYYK